MRAPGGSRAARARAGRSELSFAAGGMGEGHAARSSAGSRPRRAEPDRREGLLLAHFDLALAREFERRGEGGRARAPAHAGVGAGLDEKIVESRPVGLRADQPGQRLARLGERPDLARLEAHPRERMALSLPRVGGQQIVEVGVIGDAARRLDGFRFSPGEEIAPEARPAHQIFAGLADRRERAQPLGETLGERGSVQLRGLRRAGRSRRDFRKASHAAMTR